MLKPTPIVPARQPSPAPATPLRPLTPEELRHVAGGPIGNPTI